MTIKFQHVFLGLMGLSAMTSFVIPPRLIQPNTPAVEALFAPVARPAAVLGRWAHGRIAPDLSTDQRKAEEVKAQNLELSNTVENLTTRLIDLQALNEERNRIGPIRRLCTPFPVLGSDTGARQTLAVQGSRLQGLREGMYVLSAEGMVGRIQRVGVAGVRVQLTTDQGFRIRAHLTRNWQALPKPASPVEALVEGDGRGHMIIQRMTKDAVKQADFAVGDWAVVYDTEKDVPRTLYGQHLGRITAIADRPNAPGFALVTIEPPQSLIRLREVMVLTKGIDPE